MARFKKGEPRPPNAGRKKGSVNKATASIKQAFKEAFEELGGATALAEWARDNPTEFYRLSARLIPTELTGLDGGPIALKEVERESLRDKILASEDKESKARSPRTIQ